MLKKNKIDTKIISTTQISHFELSDDDINSNNGKSNLRSDIYSRSNTVA